MANSFEELKQAARNGKGRVYAFGAERSLVLPDLGTHKRTRLRRAGCENSRTILHGEVSKKHAEWLAKEYLNHCRGKFDSDRLRYLTILHELVPLDVESVISSAQNMSHRLERVFRLSRVWARGVIEIELVNLDLLRRIEAQTESEKRKLSVVINLIPVREHEFGGLVGKFAKGTMALVHCHVLVDLISDMDTQERKLRATIKRVGWDSVAYQVDLMSTFRNKTIQQNLHQISKYGTKGGNEQLRFKSGFGRDLAEDLDAKMWRDGNGRKDMGGDTVQDERGLTFVEIAFLDTVYRRLMDLRADKRGYLVGSGRRW